MTATATPSATLSAGAKPSPYERATVAAIVARAASPRYERWAEQLRGCGYCARPVRLTGRVTRTGPGGARSMSYSTVDEPDGVLLVRCGNRRAVVCPSCSREYQGDMWHLLRAGLAGGSKGVPNAVADRALVFATLTAPGFGPVHTTRTGRGARPGTCRPRQSSGRKRCPHGVPTWCSARHVAADPVLGEPLCAQCYDYAGAVWFNCYASSQLWRRFTTYLPRALAARLGYSERELRARVRVQYAKVAEFQRRGLVHFHAVLRLDGPGPGYPPPDLDTDTAELARLLAEAVRTAAAQVAYRVPLPAADEDAPGSGAAGQTGLVLRFGSQVDAQPVRRTAPGVAALTEGAMTPEKVAGYIAKYATKATEDLGLGDRLLRPTDLDYRPVPVSAHVRRMVETVAELAAVQPRLARWLHMLGFPGHFATKSRAFSATLGAIRAERRAFRLRQSAAAEASREGSGLSGDAAEETTLVVGSWTFAGMGYVTAGDAVLAASAAARAREHAELARDAERWKQAA
jgi:hypothetical protein